MVRLVFKELAERWGMLKAQRISDPSHGKFCGRQLFFRFVDQFFMNMLLGVQARQRFQQAAQVVGRDIQVVRNVLNSRQAIFLQLIAFKITVQ